MNKLKIFGSFFLFAALLYGGGAGAVSSYNITLESNDLECAPTGHFEPRFVEQASGETVMINFNVPADDPATSGLEIRGFPDGNIPITPGQTVSVEHEITDDLTFEAYLVEDNCLKATGHVLVLQEYTTQVNGDDAEFRHMEAESETEDNPWWLVAAVLGTGAVATLTLLGSLYYLFRTRN